MSVNKANTSEQRQCHRCRQTLPLTKQFFMSDKSRPMGLAYECKPCHSARKKGRDRRRERWSAMTPEQKAKRLIVTKRYGRTPKGRAIFLVQAYRRIDKAKGLTCDIDQSFMLALFNKPCVYCGATNQIGADRVDNSIGHIRSNVVPACADCNVMRGNRFSHAEMVVIGKAVAKVRKARGKTSGLAPNEARL